MPLALNLIHHRDLQVKIENRCLFTGWGCCLDTVTTGGNWTPDKVAVHDINCLEILAVFLALKSFEVTNISVPLRIAT